MNVTSLSSTRNTDSACYKLPDYRRLELTLKQCTTSQDYSLFISSSHRPILHFKIKRGRKARRLITRNKFRFDHLSSFFASSSYAKMAIERGKLSGRRVLASSDRRFSRLVPSLKFRLKGSKACKLGCNRPHLSETVSD